MAYNGLDIKLINSEIYNGKIMTIPIKSKLICHSGVCDHMSFSIKIEHLSSTCKDDVITMAMKTIHEKSNGSKYIIYRSNNFQPDSWFSTKKFSEIEISDVVFNGLQIQLINSDIWDGKTISIKLVTDASPSISNTNRILKTQYDHSNKMENVLQEALNMINEEIRDKKYLLKTWSRWDSWRNGSHEPWTNWTRSNETITDYAMHKIITEGLNIAVQDFIDIPVSINNNENINRISVKTSYLSFITIEDVMDKALNIIN
eukprot:440627_1